MSMTSGPTEPLRTGNSTLGEPSLKVSVAVEEAVISNSEFLFRVNYGKLQK
jgi:hypothetical protein